jgi:RNA polymerase sigma-70 factor (ECF subfamily)
VDDAAQRELLARYMEAFEQYDIPRLQALLRADAVQQMPPLQLWVQGADEIGRFMLGPGIECVGSRLLPTRANGCPAFVQYHAGGVPFALTVLDVEPSGERVRAVHTYLLPELLFPAFGFALTDDSAVPVSSSLMEKSPT